MPRTDPRTRPGLVGFGRVPQPAVISREAMILGQTLEREATSELPDHLVLFDGVCGLCNGLIRFLLRIDSDEILRFAPLQGDTAESLFERGDGVEQYRADPSESYRTMLYLRDHGDRRVLYERSDALLEILGDLPLPWSLLQYLRWVPKRIRDRVYRWVAERRYGWFGQYDECPMPEPRWRTRFLP